MVFIPTPLTVQANIIFEQDNVALENVFNFFRPAGISQSDVNVLAAAIDEWVGTSYLPLVAQGVNYVQTHVKGIYSETAYQAQSNASAGAGAGGAVVLPANVSKAITFRSGLTGRSARGRMYLVGISTSVVDLGTQHVTQTFVDDVIDALEALKTIIEALGWVWTIVSKYTNNQPRPQGLNFPITQFGVSNLTTDSMRGRLPKA